MVGFQQEYNYDRCALVVESIVRRTDNNGVELYWHADDGKLALGLIDIYGKNQIKRGKTQLATIYYHTLGSEVDILGGLTHVFTKAAERGATMNSSLESICSGQWNSVLCCLGFRPVWPRAVSIEVTYA